VKKHKLIGVWNYHNILNNSNIWFSPNAGREVGIKYSGGTESLKSFFNVYQELTREKVEIKILDKIDNLNEVDLFIFCNLDLKNKYVKKAFETIAPKYLLLLETEIHIPDMWDSDVYSKFDKIFTWHDNLIDNKKFFKINSPGFEPPIAPFRIHKDIKKKDKLCILMGSNKNSNHKLSIYHKRIEAVRWFEKNYPDKLDFYGYDWNIYIFRGLVGIRILNRFKILQKLFAPKFLNYKGEHNGSKTPLYEKYKFSLCFENTIDAPGNITEKIFDCFFAGCVPIYLGGNNNIEKYIPSDCFVDFKNFKNYEDLYGFMINTSDTELLKYINNIENFLNSSKYFIFTNEHYKQVLLREIRKEINY